MFFDDFLEEELLLIISLPARAGIWMSRVDDVAATDRDDKKEMIVLENVLKGLSKHPKATPFVSAVMEQTLTYKHMWEDWAQGGDTPFFRDLGHAVRLMEERLPDENTRNFKLAVMKIADAVAHAYDEHIGEGDDLREEMFLGGLTTRIMDRLNAHIDLENPEHVSAAEAEALQKLKTALKQ